jgi:hypothetical protein
MLQSPNDWELQQFEFTFRFEEVGRNLDLEMTASVMETERRAIAASNEYRMRIALWSGSYKSGRTRKPLR